MINKQSQENPYQDTILLGVFGYVPYLKKDSREKIIKALDDVIDSQFSQSPQQRY